MLVSTSIRRIQVDNFLKFQAQTSSHSIFPRDAYAATLIREKVGQALLDIQHVGRNPLANFLGMPLTWELLLRFQEKKTKFCQWQYLLQINLFTPTKKKVRKVPEIQQLINIIAKFQCTKPYAKPTHCTRYVPFNILADMKNNSS